MKVRAEISRKNKYWIDHHRFYELRHFCLQYNIWKKAYDSMDSLSRIPNFDKVITNKYTNGNPVERCIFARSEYLSKMEMIELAAKETDEYFQKYLLDAVTNGYTYEKIRLKTNIPCSRDKFYELFRRFFWILDNIRK